MKSPNNDKLPPDVSKKSLGSRQSMPSSIAKTRSSLRIQSSPMPTGEQFEEIGQSHLTHRKVTETPIEAISFTPRGNHVSNTVEKTGHKVRTVTEILRSDKTAYSEQSTGLKGHILESNGVSNTPKAKRKQCANDSSSPSLWMNTTPEEIVEYYRQLGPDWRNEFPKTDLTYSPGSPWYNKEVVPGSGIPVITNMSREPVGMYARKLKSHSRRNSFDLYNYTSEKSRPQNHFASHEDRRVSLSYGLDHSPHTPTTRLGYPSHAYPQYSSNYSSSVMSSFISRTHNVINNSVTIVTRLFTFVATVLSLAWHWRSNHGNQMSGHHGNESSQMGGGVDTVDNGYYHTRQRTGALPNYEYKTGAKRSSMYHRSSVSHSHFYIWTQTLLTQVYKFSSWLIETNSWLFWVKDQTVPRDRTRSCVKYALLALVLLLFGFWLYSPLSSSQVVNSTTTHSLPSASESQSYTNPLSSTGHVIYDTVIFCTTTVKTSLSATGNLLTSPFSGDLVYGVVPVLKAPFTTTGAVLSSLYHYACVPFITASDWMSKGFVFVGKSTYGLWDVICNVPSSIYQIFSVPFIATTDGMSKGSVYVGKMSFGLWDVICSVPSSIHHYVSIPFIATRDILSKGFVLAGKSARFVWEFVRDVVYTIWSVVYGGFATMVATGGALVTSLRAMSTPSEICKVPSTSCDARVSTQQPPSVSQHQENVQQKREVSSMAPVPSVEEIVLKVLSDARFTAMIEKSGDKNIQDYVEREKALYDKVDKLVRSISTQQVKSETKVGHPDDMMGRFSGLIDEKIKAAFDMYDADKTGLTDYALESAGGAVVNIRCTETYTVKDPYYVLFGYALWRRDSSPRKAIQPGLLPGDCWPFQGAVGCLVLSLSHRIKITKFSMEHIPRALTPSGEIDSAPNKFTVWGLKENYDEKPTFLGEFAYDQDGPTLQYFDAVDSAETFELVELKILSNHGNIEYTCLYRFRVHGSLAPPSANQEADYQGHLSANHNTYHHHVNPSHTKYNPV